MNQSCFSQFQTFIGCDGFSLATSSCFHIDLICFETCLATILVMGNDFKWYRLVFLEFLSFWQTQFQTLDLWTFFLELDHIGLYSSRILSSYKDLSFQTIFTVSLEDRHLGIFCTCCDLTWLLPISEGTENSMVATTKFWKSYSI